MRVLICDKDSDVRERLQRMVMDAGLQPIGRTDSVEKAIMSISMHRPEIVLMDVTMPQALQLLSYVKEKVAFSPAMIFMGSEHMCTLEVLKSGASDYLVKPLNRMDVLDSLHKVGKLNAAQQVCLSKKPTSMMDNERQYIAARTHRGMELIALADVYYFTADQKYVKVRHKNGIVLIDESLKDLEEEFGHRMFRIHRNALINLDYLELLEIVDSGQYQVRFRGASETLMVSRRHLPTLREKIHSI
ncbi:MAG: LytTR family DNA-binding domain-containing protein [Moraxella sp.]|nr:LytTR family DNA-binding domain-containing protein [Moraxella sp.]